MSMPPTYFFHHLGRQAQMMTKSCHDERLAVLLKYVGVGSVILFTGLEANQVLNEVFAPRNRDNSK
jgi:hypothetical protein